MQNLNADLSSLYNQCHAILTEYGHIKEHYPGVENFYVEIMMWDAKPVFKISIFDTVHKELDELHFQEFYYTSALIETLKQTCIDIQAKKK